MAGERLLHSEPMFSPTADGGGLNNLPAESNRDQSPFYDVIISGEELSLQLESVAAGFAADLRAPYLQTPIETFLTSAAKIPELKGIGLALDQGSTHVSIYGIVDGELPNKDVLAAMSNAVSVFDDAVFEGEIPIGESMEYININNTDIETIANNIQNGTTPVMEGLEALAHPPASRFVIIVPQQGEGEATESSILVNDEQMLDEQWEKASNNPDAIGFIFDSGSVSTSSSDVVNSRSTEEDTLTQHTETDDSSLPAKTENPYSDFDEYVQKVIQRGDQLNSLWNNRVDRDILRADIAELTAIDDPQAINLIISLASVRVKSSDGLTSTGVEVPLEAFTILDEVNPDIDIKDYSSISFDSLLVAIEDGRISIPNIDTETEVVQQPEVQETVDFLSHWLLERHDEETVTDITNRIETFFYDKLSPRFPHSMIGFSGKNEQGRMDTVYAHAIIQLTDPIENREENAALVELGEEFSDLVNLPALPGINIKYRVIPQDRIKGSVMETLQKLAEVDNRILLGILVDEEDQQSGSFLDPQNEFPEGSRTFSSKDARIAWDTTRAVEEIAKSLPPEGQELNLQHIIFDETDSRRGLRAIFAAGTVIGTDSDALLVPKRSLEILEKLHIPFKIDDTQ